jgi:hypothetical protein
MLSFCSGTIHILFIFLSINFQIKETRDYKNTELSISSHAIFSPYKFFLLLLWLKGLVSEKVLDDKLQATKLQATSFNTTSFKQQLQAVDNTLKEVDHKLTGLIIIKFELDLDNPPPLTEK